MSLQYNMFLFNIEVIFPFLYAIVIRERVLYAIALCKALSNIALHKKLDLNYSHKTVMHVPVKIHTF